MSAGRVSLRRRFGVDDRPLVLAGPAVAESAAQLAEVARRLRGVPAHFLALGAEPGDPAAADASPSAFAWLRQAGSDHGLRTAAGVTSAPQAQAAVTAGVDLLCIAGDTAQSPAAMREIESAVRGTAVPVLVANPQPTDVARWLAACERLHHATSGALAALFVGDGDASAAGAATSRVWQPLVELRRLSPELPVVVHASAVARRRARLSEVAQTALDLGAEGLIVELHGDPDHAWRWPERQITPERLGQVLGELTVRQPGSDESGFVAALAALRGEVDDIDRALLELLATRAGVVERIAEVKRAANVTTLQIERWRAMLEARTAWAEGLAIDVELVRSLFAAIHGEALRRQSELANRERVEAAGGEPPPDSSAE